jgi:DNA-binding NarL/FixJ family response regulator
MGENSDIKPIIMYVEDQQWDMGGVVRNLSVDFEVWMTRNAEQSLELLADESKRERIALILLDIRLITPSNRDSWKHQGRRAGIDFAKMVLRQLEYDIPIVCYTANLSSEISDELHRIGVAGVVEKGGSIRELKVVIKKHLKQV